MQRQLAYGLYHSEPTTDVLDVLEQHGIDWIDTAFNYRQFNSHTELRPCATTFKISTKIGFSRRGHTLDPAPLLVDAETICNELGRAPDILYIHNPEESLRVLPTDEAGDLLRSTFELMAGLVRDGLAASWGLSTWDAEALCMLIRGTVVDTPPRCLMTQTGLPLTGPQVDAVLSLRDLLRVAPEDAWGAAPFGGPRMAREIIAVPGIQGLGGATPIQAMVLAAFEVPTTATVAFSSRSVSHISEVAEAVKMEPSSDWLARYLSLIGVAQSD